MVSIPTVKVILLGDGGVGKTSLVRKYSTGKFEDSRLMTIGVDFHTEMISLPNAEVKLSIWDIAGQERFKVIRDRFYRGARCAALVYDMSDPDSLKNLVEWYKEIKTFIPNIPLAVIGNKVDEFDDSQKDWGRAFAAKIKAPYLKTSAKTGEGVSDFFQLLGIMAVKSLVS